MTCRLTLFFSVLVTIALVHAVSIELYLYWKYHWLDIPMHVLGGIGVALGYSVLPFFGIRIRPMYNTLMWYIGAVLAIGISWELFEFFAEISINEPGFVPDTTMDLFFDVVGAHIGYGLVRACDRLYDI